MSMRTNPECFPEALALSDKVPKSHREKRGLQTLLTTAFRKSAFFTGSSKFNSRIANRFDAIKPNKTDRTMVQFQWSWQTSFGMFGCQRGLESTYCANESAKNGTPVLNTYKLYFCSPK